MSISSHYTREILDELNFVATWLPSTTLVPGDVCQMNDGMLRRIGALDDFNVSFETEPGSTESTIEYKSAGAVSVTAKAAGSAALKGSGLGEPEAGLHISFAKENAILLMLTDCASSRIANVHSVGQQVLTQHAAGLWPDDYVVVTEAVACGASTILVSSSTEASIDLSFSAAVETAGFSLATANAGLQSKTERNIGFRAVSAPGLTPLLRTSGVVQRFLRPDQFRGGDAASDVDFAAVSYDDFAE